MRGRCCGPAVWVIGNAVLWFGGGAATVHLATRPSTSELGSAQAERIDEAFARLDPSEEQRAALAEVLADYEREVEEARAGFFAHLSEVEARADARILDLLDPEQRSRVPGLAE